MLVKACRNVFMIELLHVNVLRVEGNQGVLFRKGNRFMKWKFWKKDPDPDKLLTSLPTGPLPRPLFTHLVEELKLGSEWVQSLVCATRPVVDHDHLLAFRAFSPSQASLLGIEVTDYATLDGNTHLILFSGTLNTQTGSVNLMPEGKRRVA